MLSQAWIRPSCTFGVSSADLSLGCGDFWGCEVESYVECLEQLAARIDMGLREQTSVSVVEYSYSHSSGFSASATGLEKLSSGGVGAFIASKGMPYCSITVCDLGGDIFVDIVYKASGSEVISKL